MTISLFPIVLAGGSGTRLWPLSRKNYPKQFLALQSQRSLLQQTVDRVESLKTKEALIVSNDAHYFLCQEQLQSTKLPITYLLEPCARNTAPAIAVAAHYLMEKEGKDALMLILPSDHWIEDSLIWKQDILKGAALALERSLLVTFGIKPDSPKTGYGYIEAAENIAEDAYIVKSFREKPSEEHALNMLNQGDFFWNSGMFMCKAHVYLEELKRFALDIFQNSYEAFIKSYKHNDFIRLQMQAFAQCRSESIDYALMEKTDKAAMISGKMTWSDLGCWNSVAKSKPLDKEGNAFNGNVVVRDSQNCFISSEQTLVTAVGLRDQIIVATSDAVLVADKRYSQQVKELVNSLQEKHSQLLQDHARVFRPWGYYEVLAVGNSFKVKRLMVKPGAKLSLQLHQHRTEHWIVVGGKAQVTNGNQNMELTVNQSTYIPSNTKHRLSNLGDEPLYVIEVQTGEYLEEDDIKRFDDIYEKGYCLKAFKQVLRSSSLFLQRRIC